MRRVLRWLFIIPALALAGAAGRAQAQSPPPVTRVIVEPAAARILDSLASAARETRTENAACATAYSVRDSTLTIQAFGPATYAWADSVTITSRGPVCAFGVPSVHAHVAFNGWPEPSDVDKNTARLRGVWNLLLSVRDNGWLVLLY